MTRIAHTLVAGILLLSGCEKPIDLGTRSFVGATRIGDGLLVDLNRDQIAFQLEGKMKGTTISGTLAPIGNFKEVFTLKEQPDVQIILSPDDLVIFSSTTEGTKFGVALTSRKMSYEINEITGMYNFVLQYHSENQNKFSFGTFELGADYSWRSWRFADGVTSEEQPNVHGYWVDSGKGEVNAYTSDNKLFATLTVSGNGKLMVINLIAKNGLALGVRREALLLGSINGEYILLESDKYGVKKVYLADEVVFKMNKDIKIDNSRDKNKRLDLIYNKPWPGFFTAEQGEFLGICSQQTCFALNMGPLTLKQFIVAAVRQ